MPISKLAIRTRGPASGLVSALMLIALVAGSSPSEAAKGDRRSGSDPAALDVIFAIDNSGSMKANDPRFITRRVVTDFASQLPEGARLGLVLFDQGARLVEPLTESIGPGHERRWSVRVKSVDFLGQRTDSPAGIERALYELRLRGRPDAEKFIIFITDGIVDTGDRQRDSEKKAWLIDDLAAASRHAGVKILGIAFTEAADVELIQALAIRTQGEYYRVQEADDIPAVLGQIGDVLAASQLARAAGAPRVERESDGPASARPDSQRQQGQQSSQTASQPASVSSGAEGGLSGMLMVWMGTLGGLAAVATPWLRRYMRLRRLTRQELVPRVGEVWPVAAADPAPRYEQPRPLPRARPTPRTPAAKLVDIARISENGILPFELAVGRTSIGRDAANDVVIHRDTVSSAHATIDCRDGDYFLEDNRSTNGTYLNGEPLVASQPVHLKSGDRIDFSVFEFRFIIPDHEPRGGTVMLDVSSIDERLAAHAGKRPSVSPGRDQSPVSPAEGPTDFLTAFERCLTLHLEKLRQLGDSHREFLHTHFTADLLRVLSLRAEELIRRSAELGGGQSLEIARSGIHYTLVVVPGEMERAAAWYAGQHGGYATFLADRIETWTASDRECESICVITYGMTESAWISITIVPAQDGPDAVEVMSFELLSEDERRSVLSLDLADLADLARPH